MKQLGIVCRVRIKTWIGKTDHGGCKLPHGDYLATFKRFIKIYCFLLPKSVDSDKIEYNSRIVVFYFKDKVGYKERITNQFTCNQIMKPVVFCYGGILRSYIEQMVVADTLCAEVSRFSYYYNALKQLLIESFKQYLKAHIG